ncbi:MAG: UvrD-helicase domain-containing protein [Candidatus Woesebacteria bacterium]
MAIDILSNLNEQQREAVEHPLGVPAMVIAGAGSGKTKVLVTRAAHLLTTHQVLPSQILLVTFTNKAAAEMLDRLERITGTRLTFSGTFHRFCARVLRTHGHLIGLSPNFAIYDEDDQQSLMTELIKEIGYSIKEIKPRVALSMISEAKNSLITPQEYKETARGKYQEIVARLYPLYQRALQKNDAVDFDDLLVHVVTLLRNFPEIRTFYQETFQHILIDEYQDTNTSQLELTKLLLNENTNLFVVGDFSQAIYSWRGADYKNMLMLEKMYPTMRRYELSQNYRSSQSILDAASGVISHNTSHPVLALWTQQAGGEHVTIMEAKTDREEVGYVVKEIDRLLRASDDHTVAILYRTNAQSRVFEEGLLNVGIPYRLVGGVRFYSRKEIKDLLAYLRLWVNPTDEVAMKRIEKLGKRKAALFFHWLTTQTESRSEKKLTLDILDSILENTQYLKEFDEHDEEDRSRLENIQELRSVSAQYEDLSLFLEAVSLIEEEALRNRNDDSNIQVFLMSIHAAKGLEFDHVFVVGMEEGMFPHSRSLLDRMQMEEERRLCYVALTRAKKTLTLSFARQRLVYGRIGGTVISRFLAEIPQESVKHVGNAPVATSRYSSSFQFPQPKAKPSGSRFVPFDDPSIDDFLSGSLDVDSFLDKV